MRSNNSEIHNETKLTILLHQSSAYIEYTARL